MAEKSKDEWTTAWAGRTVRVYEAPAGEAEAWEFPEDYFPWLCETSGGLDFVSTDWRVREDGSFEAIQVGASLDDLIESFIGTEECYDEEKAKARRQAAIAAIEKAVQTLKTEPTRHWIDTKA